MEKLAFYGNSLNDIITLITNRYHVGVYDLDILTDELPIQGDIVLLLAILEHLNGTPRHLLERAKRMVKPDGWDMIIEVPNAANLTRRLSFLIKGSPPFPPFADYYFSEYPFSGHNREYTVRDLQFALQQKQAKNRAIGCLPSRNSGRPSLEIQTAACYRTDRSCRLEPSIWAVAKKSDSPCQKLLIRSNI